MSQIVPKELAHVMHLLSEGVHMKKGKKDRGVAQKVRIKNLDNELEMKDLLHNLTDKKIMKKKSKDK